MVIEERINYLRSKIEGYEVLKKAHLEEIDYLLSLIAKESIPAGPIKRTPFPDLTKRGSQAIRSVSCVGCQYDIAISEFKMCDFCVDYRMYQAQYELQVKYTGNGDSTKDVSAEVLHQLKAR